MDINIKRITKVVLVTPIVLLWDAVFWCISKLYKGATWVDQFGGEKIDEFLDN